MPDLEQADFTILDNGKPQEILIFENTVQPFTVVVLLDSSASMTLNLNLAQKRLKQFLLRMLPEDKGMVGAFNSKIQFSGSFTNNRDSLIGSLEDLQSATRRGSTTRIDESIEAA